MKKRPTKKSQAQKLREAAQSDHAKARADFHEITLAPGDYIMTWGGYRQRVSVRANGFGPTVTPQSGWDFSLDTVPDATFEPIP